MNYWVFVVTNQEDVSARAIMGKRFADEFWGLGEDTAHRQRVQKGDRVIFYLGKPESVFSGQAVLKSGSFELTQDQVERYSRVDTNIFDAKYGVELEDCKEWPEHNSISVEEIAPKLDLIENETYWWAYFQGGIRQITEADYETIVDSKALVSGGGTLDGRETETVAQFELVPRQG